MEARITQIGTSLGIIIPKYIREEGNFGKGASVNIEYRDNKIIISKLDTPRKGWSDAFANYAKEGADEMLMPDFLDSESLDLIR